MIQKGTFFAALTFRSVCWWISTLFNCDEKNTENWRQIKTNEYQSGIICRVGNFNCCTNFSFLKVFFEKAFKIQFVGNNFSFKLQLAAFNMFWELMFMQSFLSADRKVYLNFLEWAQCNGLFSSLFSFTWITKISMKLAVDSKAWYDPFILY